MQLYFIRHGQSQNNAGAHVASYQESSDPELTPIGLEQANILADYLAKNQAVAHPDRSDPQNRAGFGFTHMYTSLMSRAVCTAAPAARALGIPFAAWPEIHEEGGIYSREEHTRGAGLPGKPRSYFEVGFPGLSLPSSLDETGWWNRPFEADEELQPRADQFLADLLTRHNHPADRVALFSHGGFFMRLMCAMLKLPWRQASHNLRSWFMLNNGSISRIDIHNGELIICYLNRTDHFEARLITF